MGSPESVTETTQKGEYRFKMIKLGNSQSLNETIPILLDICYRGVSFTLQFVSATFLLVCFERLKKNACKTRKNVFYFNLLKALFVPEIIKF